MGLCESNCNIMEWMCQFADGDWPFESSQSIRKREVPFGVPEGTRLHFHSFGMKIEVSPSSSRRRAIVHRTIALIFRVSFSDERKSRLHLHPYRMHLKPAGLSHGLQNSPLDCFVPSLRLGRPFESAQRIKKREVPFGTSRFLVRRKGLEPPTY